jgi:HlyD family secretion protein
MQSNHSRLLLWSVIVALLTLSLIYLFWPRPVIIDMAQLSANELQVTIADEAKTRVHDIYVLSAPVTGHLRRIKAEVGDAVIRSSTVVAQIEPIAPSFLDPRSEAQAKADIQTADSALTLAQAEVNQAQAELDFALSEFGRMRELRVQNSVSERKLDNAERDYKTRRAALATAQAGLQMRVYELERNKALLLSPKTSPKERGNCECINITTPVNGRILKILNKSEGVVSAGTPLLEIGDPQDLEIVVELLSFDAVKVEPGQTVVIKNWGGIKPLEGRVNRIEPIGFMKVSALGIEEQRVNVIVDLQSDFKLWARLGHGYQVDVEIVLWQETNILNLPLTALFREKQNWAVFAIEDDIVQKRLVKIGQRNGFNAQILSGMREGDWFVLHPNDQISDGVKVASRTKFIE